MGCECKNRKSDIMQNEILLEDFKKYFIRRMLYDFDVRRNSHAYNQAIFFYSTARSEYLPSWTDLTADMVLDKYDQAMRDFLKYYCDEHEKNFFEKNPNESERWIRECRAEMLMDR
jgi:hypothetical protein